MGTDDYGTSSMCSRVLRSTETRLLRVLPRVALALALVMSSAAVHAQTKASDGDRAHLQFREAHDAIVREDWSEARRLLLELWSDQQTYDVAASLAQVEFREKNYALAARYMSYALAQIPPNEPPAKVREFERGLAEIQRHICTVMISTDERGAAIRVDGTLIGTSPLASPVYVTPGTHELEASLNAERQGAQRLECSAASTLSVELELTPRRHATSADAGHATTLHTGRTANSSTASAVDGNAGLAASSATASAVGSSAGSSVSSAVSRSAAAPLDDGPPSERPNRAGPKKSLVPVVVGGAITAVGVATWLGYWAASSSDKEELERFRDRVGADACSTGTARSRECASARDDYASQRRNAAVSRIGLGASVLAGAATLGYVLFWPDPKPTAAHWAFAPTPHGASVAITGSF